MTFARVGDLDLCYETFGSDIDPTALFVHGLGGQLLSWDEPFCRGVAAGGYRVVRFDLRDSGLSSYVDAEMVSLPALMAEAGAGEPLDVPYTLSDMATDAVGLLNGLGVERAHVVGLSMGGMIGQTIAIEHPERVRSLVSIMSTTGNPRVGQPTSPEVEAVLSAAPPPERNDAIDFIVEARRVLAGGGPFDDDTVRAQVTAAVDRAYNPEGTGRQFAAILASGDRTDRLHGLTVPTLVLHGTADPLIAPSGGEATAAAIPGARLFPIVGMGHQVPIPGAFRDRVVAEIVAFLHTVDDG
jgi:pimeloyl-ACP methyl ester carboxylesterase